MNLIPLGLLNGNALVDVSEVTDLNKGNITCPSCKSELIAKKGDVMIHHFAHKAGSKNTEMCEYSFFVSVQRAFKEHTLQNERISIRTPKLDYFKGDFGRVIEKESIKTLNKFDIDTSDSHGFSFVYIDNGIKVGVNILWDDKTDTAKYDLVDNAINIDIQNLEKKYDELRLGNSNFSFKELVSNFVLLDAHREYSLHREFSDTKIEADSAYSDYESELRKANFVMESEQDFSNKTSKHHNIDSRCVICRGLKGSKPLIEDNVCFKCVDKHFYMKGIFRLKEITEIVRRDFVSQFIN